MPRCGGERKKVNLHPDSTLKDQKATEMQEATEKALKTQTGFRFFFFQFFFQIFFFQFFSSIIYLKSDIVLKFFSWSVSLKSAGRLG